MKKFTVEEENKILEVLTQCKGDYDRAAKRTGVGEKTIMSIDMRRNRRWGWTPEGQGPKHMQKYIVATRDAGNPKGWDNMDRVLEARRLYDAGTIELVTGRDGFCFILYAIPRRVPDTKRKEYFASLIEAVA